VREFSTPLASDLPTTGSLADDAVRNAEEDPERVAFSRPVHGPRGRTWLPVTAAQFLSDVRRTGKGLLATGVAAGDRVALLARTRYEWTVVDYALWYCGAVSVPLYESASEQEVAGILARSGARVAVVEGPAHAERVRRAAPDALDRMWVLDGTPRALETLAERGRDVRDEVLEERRAAVGPDTPASILFTSGTTGDPRGCELTHGAFLAEVTLAVHELRELFDDGAEGEGAATLLVLPLAHVFARIVQVGAVRARVRLGHTEDVRHFLDDLADFAPTFLLGIPRVFEKVFNDASLRAAAAGRDRLFDRATETAIAWSASQDRRRGPVLRARHAVYDRLVYADLRAALGGRCRFAVSGGAPLGERLGHFYRGIGVPVLEGYGLTETTGAATVNLPDAHKIGTVGRPLPGTTVRVAEDGELLVRGPQVMRGYWADPDGTAEVLGADGWLRTGDLGEIDADGFVRVTGRRQEILVTAGGKNVAPGLLEDRLRSHPLVDQCLVVGDGRPYVGALVTLDPESVAMWAQTHHRRGGAAQLAQLVRDPDLRAELQRAVDEANRTVSQAESIRRFAVLPSRWTDEGGELTPSLKVRRSVVLRRHHRDIEALYL
jgi:long-chain acyl-CoA synthetase